MLIVDEIVKPKDCLLGICIPTTKADFLNHFQEETPFSAFKKGRQELGYSIENYWKYVHEPLISLLFDKVEYLEKLGVNVKMNFKIDNWDIIDKFKVATIIAHHESDVGTAEMYENVYSDLEIVNRVNPLCSNIIDFTLCESISLQETFRKYIPNCITVANKMKAGTEFRLLCYSKVIELLYKHEISYVAAITKVRVELIKSIK